MKKLFKLITVSLLTLTLAISVAGCDIFSKGISRKDAATIYKDAANAVWSLIGKENPTKPKILPSGLTIADRTSEVTGEGQKQGFIHNLNVLTLYVNFIGELLENENFVYTNKVVTFTANATINGVTSTHVLSIYNEIDKSKNKIYSEFQLLDSVNPGAIYMLMDIGYDFDKKVANSFRLIYYNLNVYGNTTQRFLNDQIYTSNGKCFINTEFSNYETELLAFEEDFSQRKSNGVKLESKFDNEYQRLNDFAAVLSSQN